ncbi:uncharacterized protein LOC144644437 isoform X3 [Oculina patagonica]
MFEFHGTIHLLASLLVAIHHVSGNNKVPTPKRPELFCFGWPNVTSVTVSIEEIPVDGIVQYDLFYNRTCPFVSLNGCSSAVTDLSLVEGCRRVENQTRTAVRTLATKDFSCTICNSTKNCYHMGITWDCDLCLYVRVNTSSGSSHVCTEQNVKMKIGNNKVPTPKRPKVFCFGLPDVTSVTVSIEALPVDGIVQYDLFYNRTCPFVVSDECSSAVTDLSLVYNRTCPFVSSDECSSAVTDLSLVEGCRRVENQTLTEGRTLATKVFSCTICNSTKNCYRMGITRDHDLCLYVRVNTSSGCSHVCTEQDVKSIIVFSPPKAIQLLATAKKQLTVRWEHREGILINYKVILQDHFGQCSNFVKVTDIYGDENGNGNSHSFTDLSPWSNYSVTICSGVPSVPMTSIPVNDTTCTCGNDYYLPGGPVFSHTLPEEPSEQPLLEPCEAFCDETNFNATLKWKASEDLIWNGIPTKSVIRIWNSSSPDQEGNKLGAPTATFSVPLELNYNGSLVSLTVNLSRHLKYIAKVQFCSNGGCGPDVMTTLSCDICESLAAPDPTSGNYSKNAESYWQLATGTGVALFILVVAVIITMVINKKKRQRNHAPLREVIGDLPPANNYEEPDSADMTSDDATYSQLYSSETQLLPKDDQTAQWV